MSQEYYTIEDKQNLGDLNIGLQVIESITKETMRKMEGVELDSAGTFSLKSKDPIVVEVNSKNQVSITIDMNVNYGVNVGTITTTIQEKIANAIYEMLGIKHVLINIQVQGINF